ncbi:MAG: AI-2E family transporter [Anaerolineae bacterium]|nr:AI-2E family transporter [Anaerolineae bacterium]
MALHEAVCPENKSILSGGLLASSPDVVVYENRPAGDDLDRWRVSAVGAGPYSLTAYAICGLINVDVDIDLEGDVDTEIDATLEPGLVTPTPGPRNSAIGQVPGLVLGACPRCDPISPMRPRRSEAKQAPTDPRPRAILMRHRYGSTLAGCAGWPRGVPVNVQCIGSQRCILFCSEPTGENCMTTGQTFRNTLVILLTLLTAYALILSIRIIIVLLVAIIFASAIRPLVISLTARRIPMGMSIILVYGGLSALLLLMSVVVFPPVLNLTAQYLEDEEALTEHVIEVQHWVEDIAVMLTGKEVTLAQPEQVREGVGNVVAQIERSVPALLDDLSTTLSEFVLIVVMGAYWLNSHQTATSFVIQLSPPRARDRVQEVINEIELTMGAYVRGSLLLLW